MTRLVRLLLIIALLPVAAVSVVGSSVAAASENNLALGMDASCYNNNGTGFATLAEARKAVDGDLASRPAGHSGEGAAAYAAPQHGCSVRIDSHPSGWSAPDGSRLSDIKVSIGDDCSCYWEVELSLSSHDRGTEYFAYRTVRSTSPGQDYLTWQAGVDFPDLDSYIDVGIRSHMSDLSRCGCDRAVSVGVRDLQVNGRATESGFGLGTPLVDNETIVGDLSPVGPIAMTLADQILGGPGAPVVALTQDQQDAVVAVTDQVLDATPEPVVAQMTTAVEAAVAARVEDPASATNAQLQAIITPVVRQYVRVPDIILNPYGAYEKATIKKLTKEERRACARQPYDCWRSRDTHNDAFTATQLRYKVNGGHNDKFDAFRHCMWSALMTKRANSNFAQSMGDAHEAAGNRTGQPPREYLMDVHNNREGRASGMPDARDSTLSYRCAEKVNTRTLDWFIER